MNYWSNMFVLMIMKRIQFPFPPYLKCASHETVARVTGWRWRQTWTISIALRATRVGVNRILIERVCIIWWQEIIVVILVVWCDRISWLWRLPWYQHVLRIETSRLLLYRPNAYHDTSTDPQYPGKLTDCTDASLRRCKMVNDGQRENCIKTVIPEWQFKIITYGNLHNRTRIRINKLIYLILILFLFWSFFVQNPFFIHIALLSPYLQGYIAAFYNLFLLLLTIYGEVDMMS